MSQTLPSHAQVSKALDDLERTLSFLQNMKGLAKIDQRFAELGMQRLTSYKYVGGDRMLWSVHHLLKLYQSQTAIRASKQS